MCKKSIFQKLLLNLTKECVFSSNGKLLKQIDGWSMGGTISVVVSDIFMWKMEFDVVVPAKLLFCKRYVYYKYVSRKKNIKEILLKGLNAYHQNIKLTVEMNSSMIFDTELDKKYLE